MRIRLINISRACENHQRLTKKEFERTKGSGAGMLACLLRDNFLGVSRAKIQTILNMDKSHYRRNAKLLNKAKLKPIRATDIHVRHQIDLIDMSKKGSVKMNGHLYRHVLTVMMLSAVSFGFVLWKANQARLLQVNWNLFIWSMDRQK